MYNCRSREAILEIPVYNRSMDILFPYTAPMMVGIAVLQLIRLWTRKKGIPDERVTSIVRTGSIVVALVALVLLAILERD